MQEPPHGRFQVQDQMKSYRFFMDLTDLAEWAIHVGIECYLLLPSWTKTLDDESALSFRSSDSPSGHSGRIRLYFQPCSEATVNFMNI